MRLFCPTAQAISVIPQVAISHHLQACDFNHLATVHGLFFHFFVWPVASGPYALTETGCEPAG
ncbi:hypothetical protein [Bradyrhizobium sp. WSM1417]|uniref:hypothetical protein n=1 Tax=Bradyrhizobium sp. WSM1417 TaxID=754500 RepID=UPI0012EB256B|nr:hypothetical protein [Bradyrhizobium sp. WSM1417]